jgi:GNAT superfamily N-acetyltransferase
MHERERDEHVARDGSPRAAGVRRLSNDGLRDDLLAHFERRQRTTRVVRAGGAIEDDAFDDDWDEVAKASVIIALRDCVRRGGVVVGAFEGERLVGFASVEPERFGPDGAYVEMPYLHVTEVRRGRGIGAQLFRGACDGARGLGATRLYIGAHPSVETQAFYRRMGCIESAYVHTPILEHEPLDLQLERVLE